MAHHLVLDLDAVAAVHVPRSPRDIERIAAIRALDERNHLRRRRAFVHQPPNAQRRLEAERDPGLHVGELFLEELGLSERPAELLTVKAILAGGAPAILRRAHHAPGNAVARTV